MPWIFQIFILGICNNSHLLGFRMFCGWIKYSLRYSKMHSSQTVTCSCRQNILNWSEEKLNTCKRTYTHTDWGQHLKPFSLSLQQAVSLDYSQNLIKTHGNTWDGEITRQCWDFTVKRACYTSIALALCGRVNCIVNGRPILASVPSNRKSHGHVDLLKGVFEKG